MRPVAPFMMMPMLDCDTGGPLQPAQPECFESASPYRNGGSEWYTTKEQDGPAARLEAGIADRRHRPDRHHVRHCEDARRPRPRPQQCARRLVPAITGQGTVH